MPAIIELAIYVASLSFALWCGINAIKAHSEYTCKAKGIAINMEVQYNTATGCMVKTEQGWIDYDKLIYIKNLKKE